MNPIGVANSNAGVDHGAALSELFSGGGEAQLEDGTTWSDILSAPAHDHLDGARILDDAEVSNVVFWIAYNDNNKLINAT